MQSGWIARWTSTMRVGMSDVTGRALRRRYIMLRFIGLFALVLVFQGVPVYASKGS